MCVTRACMYIHSKREKISKKTNNAISRINVFFVIIYEESITREFVRNENRPINGLRGIRLISSKRNIYIYTSSGQN